MTTKRDWSKMPLDIFFLIASQKQLSLADVGRMAVVCKPWKTNIKANNWFGFHVNENIGTMPFPWLILAEPSPTSIDPYKRGLFNPATGQVTEVYLPEAKGRRCCGSCYGWIITMGDDMEMNLLNPLTRELLIGLPSLLAFDYIPETFMTLDEHGRLVGKELLRTFIGKAILTCSPSKPECVVVFTYGLENFAASYLAFAKIGDSKWTTIPPPLYEEAKTNEQIDDFLFHEGRLFANIYGGGIFALDLFGMPQHEGWQMIAPRFYKTCRMFEHREKNLIAQNYLAIIEGDFFTLVRVKLCDQEEGLITKTFVVFKLHKGEWLKIDDIGDSCFFVGTNKTTVVSPVPRGYSSNSIYFSDDRKLFGDDDPRSAVGNDTAVFSLDTGKIRLFCNEVSLSKFSPPVWVVLNFSRPC